MSNRLVRKARHTIQRNPSFSLPRSADADAIASELARLEKENGGLTAEIVVDAARKESSAMHDAFIWDDDEAAQRWRLHQARNLIRSIKVVIADHEQRSVYVHVSDDEAYRPMKHVVTQPNLYALALAEAQSRVNSAVAAFRELENAASGTADGDQLAKITMAIKALETARSVAQSLH